MKAEQIINIFKQAIIEYHFKDDVNQEFQTSHQPLSLAYLLYKKNWIDTVQWHLEDIIRSPNLPAEELVKIKRRIDASNQDRTDTVEEIDEFLYHQFKNVDLHENPKLNSETPAWLLDRMSILQLKIYHFEDQLKREDIDKDQRLSVEKKLFILKIQEEDLNLCFDELIEDLKSGKKYMKLYKQMKMYNDPKLNPVLYKK
jgi:hypothetical protein